MTKVYLCNVPDEFRVDYDIAIENNKWGVKNSIDYKNKRDLVSVNDILILENKEKGAIIGKITDKIDEPNNKIWELRDGEVYPYRVKFDIIYTYEYNDINDILIKCLKDSSGRNYKNPQALGMSLRGPSGQFRNLEYDEYCCIFKEMQSKTGKDPIYSIQKEGIIDLKCGNNESNSEDTKKKGEERPIESNNLPKNIILHGPVGTGKTYFARILGKGIINGNIKNLDDLEHWLSKLKSGDESLDELYSKKIENDRLFTVTFHQSYSYEDFIEGIRAKASGDKIEYEIEPGIFKEVCNNAKKPENKTKSYVIIIDEINRGDISRIFGELITLLDDDKRCRGENNDYLEFYLKLPYSKEDFCVPENVYVIGTMNDSDRSIALLDIALRRRFTFIKVPPNEVILERWIKDDDEFKQMVKSVFNTLNERISEIKGEDFEIGHAFFKSLENATDKKKELLFIFKNKIIPLLKEIFYGQEDILLDKILNGKFFEIKGKKIIIKDSVIDSNNLNDFIKEFKGIIGDQTAQTQN